MRHNDNKTVTDRLSLCARGSVFLISPDNADSRQLCNRGDPINTS